MALSQLLSSASRMSVVRLWLTDLEVRRTGGGVDGQGCPLYGEGGLGI